MYRRADTKAKSMTSRSVEYNKWWNKREKWKYYNQLSEDCSVQISQIIASCNHSAIIRRRNVGDNYATRGLGTYSPEQIINRLRSLSWFDKYLVDGLGAMYQPYCLSLLSKAVFSFCTSQNMRQALSQEHYQWGQYGFLCLWRQGHVVGLVDGAM